MRILIIGSGAREHALARSLAASPSSPELACFAGTANPGISRLCGHYRTGSMTGTKEMLEFAGMVSPDLAVIGPEAPLEAGAADGLRSAGIPTVGPGSVPARIETSKVFARDLLRQVCPEASPDYHRVTSLEEAREALRQLGEDYVIKEEGLRGGKGVKVAGEHLESHEAALAWCEEILRNSPRLIIEEKLEGQEFSLLSFCDGVTCSHMPPVQDHKRAWEGDAGPNTGGMGSYSGPYGTLPFLSSREVHQARDLQQRVFRGIQEHTGESYQGILYGGYMATATGVKIIEYNARFGDPEVLNLLALLESDLAEICRAVTRGTLTELEITFSPRASVCKYLVPAGYPEQSVKGLPVKLPILPENISLSLGSVDQSGDELVTAGSRTLAVTALGDTLEEAEAACEEAAVRFPGLYHRRDIGSSELIMRRIEHMERLKDYPLRIGVLGSTRGTSLQPLLDAAETGRVNARIECVITNRKSAYIRERAAAHHVPSCFVPGSRIGADDEMTRILEAHRVDMVLCIGYMRIISPAFCRRWEGRVFNIHPSLLPDFGRGMDTDVHAAVLASGVSETGCTVHHVTPEVDEGPILLQKRCPVHPDDSVLSLKDRVQALEGEALTELVRDYQKRKKDGKKVNL